MWGKVKTIFRKNKLFLFSSIQNEKNKQKNRIILKLFVFLQKKSIPPFYFSHFEWSYNRNVQEIKRI